MFSLLHGLVVAVFMALASSGGGAQPDGTSASSTASVAGLGSEQGSLSCVFRLPMPSAAAGITQAVTLAEALDAEAEAEEEDPTGDGYALARPQSERGPSAFTSGGFLGQVAHWGTWHLPSGHPRAPPTA